METTGRAFVEHWSWVAEKGLMNPATAASMKSACIKVMGVLDDWEALDVREVDVEDAIHRFQNLKAREFTPSSLETYASRFRKALSLFKDYASNPAGWRVSGRQRRQKSPEKVSGSDRIAAPDESAQAQTREISRTVDEPHLITYPFPLRRGLTVKLSLPDDLTAGEARRLSAFLATLSSDFASEEVEARA